MKLSKFKISIIIPAFNEEGNIEKLVNKLIKILKTYRFELLFIDDGSTDTTLSILKKISYKNKNIKFLSFSRNFGHQSALKAGIDYAKGDCVISMDCDLQHPPELIPKMIQAWQKGYEVVYTIRNDKKTPFRKKIISSCFYGILNKISDIHIEDGTADFRLLDRKVVDVIKNLHESVIFLRGLINWCGFRQSNIVYIPHERFSGSSKYSFKKMFFFALDGITSFSIRPLQISTYFGFVLAFFSGIYAVYAAIMHLLDQRVLTGWTSVIISVLFLGGIQLIILGILGEYLGKLFIESKKRPTYIIHSTNIK